MIGRSPRPLHRPAMDADRLVHAVLMASERPLSAYDIRDAAMEARQRLSIPLIYRAVARLMAKGRVRRVETLNAYMVRTSDCEAVAICRLCGATMAVPAGDLAQRIAALLAPTGFVAEQVVIEAQGRCSHCLGLPARPPARSHERRATRPE